MGIVHGRYIKGVYFNGHEREDVVRYRNEVPFLYGDNINTDLLQLVVVCLVQTVAVSCRCSRLSVQTVVVG